MDLAETIDDPLAHFEDAHPATPTRGIPWVLQWAAALATLSTAFAVLAEFSYCLTAELALSRAARGAAHEASLPRATYRSVAAAVTRRLSSHTSLISRLRFSMHRNGIPVQGPLHSRPGDRLSVTLTVPSDAVLPQWLRTLAFWHKTGQIEVRAERHIPGRELLVSSSGR